MNDIGHLKQAREKELYLKLMEAGADEEVLDEYVSFKTRSAIEAELKDILEHGHGGGNWRRLIMSRMGKKDKDATMPTKVKYTIEESHKYEGCYNIYDNDTAERVKYFAEQDDKNLERAKKWVKKHE